MGWQCPKCGHDSGELYRPSSCPGCGIVFRIPDHTDKKEYVEARKRDRDTFNATFLAVFGFVLGVLPLMDLINNNSVNPILGGKGLLICLGAGLAYIGGTFAVGKIRDYDNYSYLNTRIVRYTHGGSESVMEYKEHRGAGYWGLSVVVNGILVAITAVRLIVYIVESIIAAV